MMRTDTYDPELWQLVPKEPTPEMVRVRLQSPMPMLRLGHEANTRVHEWRNAMYQGMLAAAPTPPASAQSVEPVRWEVKINGEWKQVASDAFGAAFCAEEFKVHGFEVRALYTTPPSAEGARDAVLMSDIREYLEDGLETSGFAEAQGSIDARALIARIDALKSKKES